jgi:hypothetical protein
MSATWRQHLLLSCRIREFSRHSLFLPGRTQIIVGLILNALRFAARRAFTPPREARVGDPGACGARKNLLSRFDGTTPQPSIPLRQAQGHLVLSAQATPTSQNRACWGPRSSRALTLVLRTEAREV